MKYRKDIYFVFKNKQECNYHHRNVFFELENDATFRKNHIINKCDNLVDGNGNLLCKCDSKLFIKVSILTTIPFSLSKKIKIWREFGTWCPLEDEIVSKNIYFRFVIEKDFSVTNKRKDLKNTYYFIKDGEDYTDNILYIIKKEDDFLYGKARNKSIRCN